MKKAILYAVLFFGTLMSSVVWAQTNPHYLPKKFSTQRLNIENMTASIEIMVRESKEMEVVVEGPADLIQGLTMVPEGETLHIQSHGMGDAVSPTGKMPKITIILPEKTPIQLSNIRGDIVIGNVNGPLVMKNCAANTQIGIVQNATLHMTGSSQVKLRHVKHRLDAVMDGRSELTVNKAHHIIMNLRGQSRSTLGVISGEFDVAMDGPVKLKVLSGTPGSFNLNMQGDGDFIFDGKAVNANVKVTGDGSIYVKETIGEPKLVKNGKAKVTFGNKLKE